MVSHQFVIPRINKKVEKPKIEIPVSENAETKEAAFQASKLMTTKNNAFVPQSTSKKIIETVKENVVQKNVLKKAVIKSKVKNTKTVKTASKRKKK